MPFSTRLRYDRYSMRTFSANFKRDDQFVVNIASRAV
jgi:hypothetical protein